MIKNEKAKIVKTYSVNSQKENGYLMELKKNGNKTEAYLTTVKSLAFKGFHLHKVRESNYVCISGKVDILLVKDNKIDKITMEVGDKLNIPTFIPTGIWNPYEGEAFLINFPNPAYDPELLDEQVDFAPEVFNFNPGEK